MEQLMKIIYSSLINKSAISYQKEWWVETVIRYCKTLNWDDKIINFFPKKIQLPEDS